MGDALADESSSVAADPILNNNEKLPADILNKILGFLPQRDVVSCRKVCRYWRDVIDEHCPMKDVIALAEDDKFLDRKLQLKISHGELSYFSKRSPNISLSYPEAIERFTFLCETNHDELDANNANGILRQIKPFVEDLSISCKYFGRNNIFSPPYLFPNITTLQIGCFGFCQETNCHTMYGNLEILFLHQFPLLENLLVFLPYENKKLMSEDLPNFLIFLAKHSQTLKAVFVKVCHRLNDHEGDGPTDFPEADKELILSKEVELLLSNSKFQIEDFSLYTPLNYVNAWVPIIKTQTKLNYLLAGSDRDCGGPGGLPFHSIVPGIQSNISTLRFVCLYNMSSVRYDGISWIPLDASVFRDAENLTDLSLGRNILKMDRERTPRPNEHEGAEIINLDKVNSTSLKKLFIANFVCNSVELQTLIDTAPILETLFLADVLAPPTSDRFAETGVHGGIIQSFLEKESKRSIEVLDCLNFSDEGENDKLEAIRLLYPEGWESEDSFILSFPEQL